MTGTRDWIKRHWVALTLGGIVLLAAFFRFYQLNSLPPGLHPDEAANGLDIFRMIDHHDFRPLYNTNGPREALFFYLQAIFVLIMGNTVLALRMAPALIGTLEVITVYLWIRSWFGQKAALLAAFLMAITPWALYITRDGFRASMTPLVVTGTLWAYTRAIQTGKRWRFIVAGLIFGSGFYTYLAFRLFPLALIAIVAYSIIWHRDWIRQWWRGVALSLVATAVVLLPMGIFAIHNYQDVLGARSSVSITNPGLNHGHLLSTFLSVVGKTALMFNIHGDDNYRQNLGGQPELSVYVGIMFIFGILVAIARFKQLRYLALLAVFATMLLPEVLTAEGIPHALRAIGALAPALALAAVGIEETLKIWYGVFPLNSAARTLAIGTVLLLLALTADLSYQQYFVAWAGSTETYEAYSEDMVKVADLLNHDSFKGPHYAVVDGYSIKTVEYLTHNHSTYTRLDPADIAKLPTGGAKQFVIERSFKDDAIKQLKAHLPGGVVQPHYGFGNREIYYVYQVNS